MNIHRICQSIVALRIGKNSSRDDDLHDLVGSLQDLVDPNVPHELLDGIVLQVTVAAMHLEGSIHNLEAGISRLLPKFHDAKHVILRRSSCQWRRAWPWSRG